MTKILGTIGGIIQNLNFKRYKRKCTEYTTFEIEEDGKRFTISLKFDNTISSSNKKEISNFIENSLIKESIDILTVLELVRRIYNVTYLTEGENGKKVSLYFKT